MDSDMELIDARLGAFPGAPLHGALATDTGRERAWNEDAVGSFVPTPGGPAPLEAVVVVADGVGGHEGGARASRFVVDAVRDTLADQSGLLRDLPAWLSRLLTSIHQGLLEEARAGNAPASLGSTATLAAFQGRTLILAHVGDSRAYRLRNGRLEQLTRDDSWVAEQQRRGMLAEDAPEARTRRNVLTQCLGIGKSLKVQIREEGVSIGDRYLLSSDGLHGVVSDDEIRDVLASEAEPRDAARRLVDLANDGGGPDNISAVVVDLGTVPLYGWPAPPPGVDAPAQPAPSPVSVPAPAAPAPIPVGDGRRRRASTTLTTLGAGLLALSAGSWIALSGSSPASAGSGPPTVPAAAPDTVREPAPSVPTTPMPDVHPDTAVIPEGDTTAAPDTLPSPDSTLTPDTLIPIPTPGATP